MPSSTDIVVSRFAEDTDWLRRLEPHGRVVLYNKNPNDQVENAILLPNLGREGHTYLHHIIEHYDRLPDVTVFLQGRIDDHLSGDPVMQVCRMQAEALLTGCSQPLWASPANYSFQHPPTYGSAKVQPAGCCLGEWFEHVLHCPFPSRHLRFYRNGLFAASRARIRGRPVEYYEAILEHLLHENPEAGHFLERSWVYMLGADTGTQS
jgi:hypothetical protein